MGQNGTRRYLRSIQNMSAPENLVSLNSLRTTEPFRRTERASPPHHAFLGQNRTGDATWLTIGD